MQIAGDEALQQSLPVQPEETASHGVADRVGESCVIADRAADQHHGNALNQHHLGGGLPCISMGAQHAKLTGALQDIPPQGRHCGGGKSGAQVEQVRAYPLLPLQPSRFVEEEQEVEVLVAYRFDVQVGVIELLRIVATNEFVGLVRPGGNPQHIDTAADEAVDLQRQAVGFTLQLMLVIGIEARQQQAL
ncbi:hypothetical protein FQZ97_891400 [compost metagenome]